jgi:hypothetical protein
MVKVHRGLAWFNALLHEQHWFSFGFSRIRNPKIIEALNALWLRQKKARPIRP